MYKKYNYNENYFEKIDSFDKAYFLGLLYADGNVYLGSEFAKKKRNRVQISLQNRDSYILQKFLNYIGSNSVMYSDKVKYTKLILDNKKLCKDLINQGCMPNKAFKITFPTNISDNLIHHFIRGYFDGDGGANFNNSGYLTVSITSNESFIKGLQNYLYKKGIESTKFSKRYKSKIDSSGSIYIGKEKSKIKFRDLLYENCNDLYLIRKKEKFDKL